MSDLVSDIRSAPSEGIWHSLCKFVLVLIALAASLPIAHAFLPEFSLRKNYAARIESLKAQAETERMKLARYQREETLLRRDPEYIGIIARDRLDLMRDGETIYRIDPPKPANSQLKLRK